MNERFDISSGFNGSSEVPRSYLLAQFERVAFFGRITLAFLRHGPLIACGIVSE